jgi:hypothetical protein
MKKPVLIPTILLFFISIGLAEQNAQIIHNRATPHYGEIALELDEDLILGSEKEENYLFYRIWDIQADARGNIFVLDSGASRIQKYDKNGKYLRTIGRQGQGPGEFERPIMLTMDKHDNLYVGEMAKIHTFDPGGKFVKTTKVPFFFMDFAPDGEGNFVLTGRITVEGAQNLGVMILDSEGNTRKKIAEFPGLPVHETGTTISHDYTPEIRFSSITDKGFVYGYSLDYKLYIADWSGKNLIITEKDVPSKTISNKEKNKIIDDIRKNAAKAGLGWSKSLIEKMANLPKHRPFFDRILLDDKGRMYVRQHSSILDKSGEMDFDIFGNEGHYLYSTKLPFVPMCIRNGFMYHTTYSEETEEVKVIRYRVKNWDRLASSLN